MATEFNTGGDNDLNEAVKSRLESNPNTNTLTDENLAKLTAIQAEATKNETDAALRDRSTHTGTQPASSIAGLLPNVQAVIDDTNEYTDGTIIRTREEGFAYRVDSTATDPDLENSAATAQKLVFFVGQDGFVPLNAIGIDGNDAVDQATEIAAAIQKHGRVKGAPGEVYLFTSSHSAEITKDTIFDANGSVVRFEGSGQLKIVVPVSITLSLASNILKGDQVIDVADASGVVVGDLVTVRSESTLETDFNYRKKVVASVVSISSNTITLSKPFRFGYSTGETNLAVEVSNPTSVGLHGDFEALGTATSSVQISRATGVNTDNLRFSGPNDYIGYPLTPWGLQVIRSIDWRGHNMSGVNMGYVFSPEQGTTGTYLTNLYTNNTRHIVDPASLADGVTVDGLTAHNSLNSINSHPAFDVNYINATCWGEEGSINMRSFGGSVKNSFVNFRPDAADLLGRSRFNAITAKAGLEFLFEADPVQIDGLVQQQNGSPYGIVAIENGEADVDNLVCEKFRIFDDVNGVKLGGSIRALLERSNDGIRAPVRLTENPLKDAVFDGTSYVIDMQQRVVDQTGLFLYCYGSIFNSQDVGTFNIKIKENGFGMFDSPNVIGGQIKFFATVFHDSSDRADALEEHFPWVHKTVASSFLKLPTTPQYSANSATTGNNLSFTVSNVTDIGASESANAKDWFVAFDLTTAMDVNNPKISLAYELKMWGIQ